MKAKSRTLRTLLALAAVGVFAFLLTPGSSRGSEAPAATPPPAPEGFALNGDPAHGRELFAKHCAVCHGERGEGDGKLSPHLKPPPGKLPERVAQRSDWELYRIVRDGGPAVGRSPVMVGFGERLEPQDLMDLATFVRSLERKAG